MRVEGFRCCSSLGRVADPCPATQCGAVDEGLSDGRRAARAAAATTGRSPRCNAARRHRECDLEPLPRQHRRRLPPQRRTPRPAGARRGRATPTPARPPRGLARAAPPPARRHGSCDPRRSSTRCTSSSAAPSPTQRDVGSCHSNVALADAPRLRSIPKVEQQAWSADELRAFLRAACWAPTVRRLLGCCVQRHAPATSCSACAGMTWTRPPPLCRSTAVCSPSPTSSARLEARPATPVAASISTRPPSRSSSPGGIGNTQSRQPPDPTPPVGSSLPAPASRSSHMPCPRRSNASPAVPACCSSDCTTCATPTERC
jgi:hypothetical protein